MKKSSTLWIVLLRSGLLQLLLQYVDSLQQCRSGRKTKGGMPNAHVWEAHACRTPAKGLSDLCAGKWMNPPVRSPISNANWASVPDSTSTGPWEGGSAVYQVRGDWTRVIEDSNPFVGFCMDEQTIRRYKMTAFQNTRQSRGAGRSHRRCRGRGVTA